MSPKNPVPDAERLVQSKLSKLFVHDMKNPLSALSANLSFLKELLADEPDEVRGAINDSLLGVKMLLLFAENLNAIAALEAGEPGEESRMSLPDLLASCVDRNRALAESAGVRLRLSEPLPCSAFTCWAHGAVLALDNLVLSAVRHSPPDGEVTLASREEGGTLVLSVCDQGKPVAPDKRAGLLTREVQSEAKKDPGSRYGRGLGLYAAGLAATALGGSVAVASRDGATEFALRIPLRGDK